MNKILNTHWTRESMCGNQVITQMIHSVEQDPGPGLYLYKKEVSTGENERKPISSYLWCTATEQNLNYQEKEKSTISFKGMDWVWNILYNISDISYEKLSISTILHFFHTNMAHSCRKVCKLTSYEKWGQK